MSYTNDGTQTARGIGAIAATDLGASKAASGSVAPAASRVARSALMHAHAAPTPRNVAAARVKVAATHSKPAERFLTTPPGTVRAIENRAHFKGAASPTKRIPGPQRLGTSAQVYLGHGIGQPRPPIVRPPPIAQPPGDIARFPRRTPQPGQLVPLPPEGPPSSDAHVEAAKQQAAEEGRTGYGTGSPPGPLEPLPDLDLPGPEDIFPAASSPKSAGPSRVGLYLTIGAVALGAFYVLSRRK